MTDNPPDNEPENNLEITKQTISGDSQQFSDKITNQNQKNSRVTPDIVDGNLSHNDIAGHDVSLYHSADYLALQARLEKKQQQLKKYPDDSKLEQALKEAQQQLEDFKRDALKLAEYFNNTQINTERLRLAKHYFKTCDYEAARSSLSAKELGFEQEMLLAKQQHLQIMQAQVNTELNNNAAEFFLKAKLTALDHNLPNRIEQTCQFFELALKSVRTAENLFAYACFLQEHKQISAAEKMYTEALGIYRQLAETNPAAYLADVAMTLNNLGNLLSEDRHHRREEAESFYSEALCIRRQLATKHPEVYAADLATTLNNLGILISADSSSRIKAENLYSEALDIQRQLTKANPTLYLPDLAMILSNLGILVSADSSRQAEAEELYTEALDIYRQLAVEKPMVYLPEVANTLTALGFAYLNWEEAEQALIFLEEAAKILAPFAEQSPSIFADKQAIILQLTEQAAMHS